MAIDEKNKRGQDTFESLAPKIARPLLRWLATFFSLDFVRRNMDAIQALSFPMNLLLSYAIPNWGILRLVSSAGSIMADELPDALQHRLNDREKAKKILFQKRKDASVEKAKKASKKTGKYVEPKKVRPVDDDIDRAEINAILENELNQRQRDLSLEELQKTINELKKKIGIKFKITYEFLKDLPAKLKKAEKDPKFQKMVKKVEITNCLDKTKPIKWLDELEIEKNLNWWSLQIAFAPKKRLIRKSRISRFFDKQAEKLRQKIEKEN